MSCICGRAPSNQPPSWRKHWVDAPLGKVEEADPGVARTESGVGRLSITVVADDENFNVFVSLAERRRDRS